MSFLERALINDAAEEIVKYIDDTHAIDVDRIDIVSILNQSIGPFIDAVTEGINIPDEEAYVQD